MRTTLELPDDLLKQAKARAALQGVKLKDFVADALRAALYYRTETAGQTPHVSDGAEHNRIVLSDDCAFPLIHGANGPALANATHQSLTTLLEEEDVERSLGTRRR